MKRTVTGLVLIVLLVAVLSSCAIRRGIVHEVKQGQTLWRIAQVYDVKLETLMDVNDIANARNVEAGTGIIIPGASRHRDVPASPQRRMARNSSSNMTSDASSNSSYGNPDPEAPDRSSSSNSSSTSTSSPKPDPPENGSSREASSSEEDSSAEASGKSSGEEVYFDPVWPCQGRLASRYEKKGGPTKRGIRIHTSRGSPVRAADDGNVKLAGEWEKMPDLGKIVIIFHSNDFTTVYAHLKSVKVSEGSKIERGDRIGTVGHSGDVKQPMCYFEVRYKLEPRDPLIFLGEPS